MKITYRFLISISTSIGFTFLLISLLAFVQTILVHAFGQTVDGFWDTYMKSSNTYDEFVVYIFAVTFVFFLLFYVVQIQKKSLRF